MVGNRPRIYDPFRAGSFAGAKEGEDINDRGMIVLIRSWGLISGNALWQGVGGGGNGILDFI